jgi:hypothetical protein
MPLRPPAGFISAFYDPLQVANAPTIGTATGGDSQASVTFTAPSNVGGSAITAYYAVSNPGQITSSAASSPVTVTGLTNGTSYTFTVWALNSFGPSAFSAASGSVSPAGPRGLFAGGSTNSGVVYNIIDYISISTTGNATDFGDLTNTRYTLASVSSSSRAIFAGGRGVGGSIFYTTMDYVTIASSGNASNFGNLISGTASFAGTCGNSTRGVITGGWDSSFNMINVIQYVTIASSGNATDFGDLTANTAVNGGCSCGNSVYGIIPQVGFNTNVINYLTIASTGNAVYFGDIWFAGYYASTCSNSTRGLIMGGSGGPGTPRPISYLTISTSGSASYFGNLTRNTYYGGSCASSTRGVNAGGQSGESNVIDYVTIDSTGNATNFGNLTVARYEFAACSNAHGGL